MIIKSSIRLTIILIFFILNAIPASAAPITFSEDFNDGVLDDNLKSFGLSWSSESKPDPNLILADGKATAELPVGFKDGGIHIETKFDVIGDFVATVRIDRIVSNPGVTAGLSFTNHFDSFEGHTGGYTGWGGGNVFFPGQVTYPL